MISVCDYIRLYGRTSTAGVNLTVYPQSLSINSRKKDLQLDINPYVRKRYRHSTRTEKKRNYPQMINEVWVWELEAGKGVKCVFSIGDRRRCILFFHCRHSNSGHLLISGSLHFATLWLFDIWATALCECWKGFDYCQLSIILCEIENALWHRDYKMWLVVPVYCYNVVAIVMNITEVPRKATILSGPQRVSVYRSQESM